MKNPVNSLDSLKAKLSEMGPIHFLGVAGSGMRPLAQFAHACGAVITGSDSSTLPVSMPFPVSHDGSEMALQQLAQAKTVVFSSAIKGAHPALQFATSSGKGLLHRSEFLGLLTAHYKTISIAGTHGKSTVSALITHILLRTGQEPSWIIGAAFANGREAFGVGSSNLLVIEADESDGTFLRYHSEIGLINNVEPDHLDFYGEFSSLRDMFGKFAATISPTGTCVYLADSTDSSMAASYASCESRGFGCSDGNAGTLVHWEPRELASLVSVSIFGETVDFHLPLTGRHNALNALAAILIAERVGVMPSTAAAALGDFPGVSRRLQRYPAKSPLLVFDDYAHNPGKILGCLQGLRAAFPERRILAIFQPHRYSRISSLYHEFIRCFAIDNALVIVLPVYAAGESPRPGYSPEDLAAAIATSSGTQTFWAATLKDASNLVKSMADPLHDVVVTLGAGDVWTVAATISGSRAN